MSRYTSINSLLDNRGKPISSNTRVGYSHFVYAIAVHGNRLKRLKGDRNLIRFKGKHYLLGPLPKRGTKNTVRVALAAASALNKRIDDDHHVYLENIYELDKAIVAPDGRHHSIYVVDQGS